MPRHPPYTWVAAIVLCAVVPPPALHAALAAAAGTLFEAAPFVLAARLLPPGRLRALAHLGGCGCRGGPLPGALAIPAFALTWLAFGPPVALARAILALAVLALARVAGAGRATAPVEHGDRGPGPLVDLAGLVPATLAAALARDALVPVVATLAAHGGWALAIGLPLEFLFGAALGLAMPCATAGVAVAAGLRGTLPAVALGLLGTSGLTRMRRPPPLGSRRVAPPASDTRERPRVRLAYASLAVALGIVAACAPPGFVTPRLLPIVGLGALAAIAHLRAAEPERARFLAPAIMLAGLVLGSPVPRYTADATALEGAFAGEALAFTGIVHRHGVRTTLERFTITCCRIDAESTAVVLARDLRARDGTWVTATGTLVRGPSGGLRLAVDAWLGIPAPRDPFAYR